VAGIPTRSAISTPLPRWSAALYHSDFEENAINTCGNAYWQLNAESSLSVSPEAGFLPLGGSYIACIEIVFSVPHRLHRLGGSLIAFSCIGRLGRGGG
jgi:hypothetical protein